MVTLREAAQQALEALNILKIALRVGMPEYGAEDQDELLETATTALRAALESDDTEMLLRQHRFEIGQLRAALAEPAEPVAWMCPDDPERETAFAWKAGHCDDCGKQRIPLYTAPTPRKPLTAAQQALAYLHGAAYAFDAAADGRSVNFEGYAKSLREAFTALRAALAAPDHSEHVLEMVEPPHTLTCLCGAEWDIHSDGREELVEPPAQRKPLTEEQIDELIKQNFGYITAWQGPFVRAIEAAHGITGDSK